MVMTNAHTHTQIHIKGQVAQNLVEINGHTKIRTDKDDFIIFLAIAISNKSVLSQLRMLTTWHCPQSLAAAAAID